MRDAALQSVALGFFDGVHRGHRAILSEADRAVTFANHPLSVLAPARAPRLLMSLDSRVAAIRACGVREVTVLAFTPELAQLAPAEFAARYLAQAVVRCGANAHFGKGGAGDAAWLRANGYAVVVVPYAVYAGEPVSSSRIRATVSAGKIAEATEMLGHAFTVSGLVETGKGLGVKLGYPTVNVRLDAGLVELPRGVYAVEVAGCRGIANYGIAPTLGADAWVTPRLEIHFLDASETRPCVEPGLPLTAAICHFIRAERRFESVDDLKRQIATDCSIVRKEIKR